MADTVVQELVINTLTQAQFDAAKESGTLSPYELYGTPDTSVRLPVLTPMWFDHVANDISWLRADTFSWQSGDVYVAAYEHLAEDVEVISYIVSLNSTYYRTPSDDVVINGTQYYAWTTEFGGVLLTTSATPQTSDSVYNRDGTVNVGGIQNFVTYIKGAQTETIGDITISYSLADDGHKICLPDQESNISALYEATGVAWYYLLDTVNKQFKLPRTKWGFTGLRDSVGGYVEQEVLLPNITGVVTGIGDVTVSGAFARGSKVSGNGGGGGSITADTFKASRSSSVYSGDGTNTLIQPRATQMYLYFYVGNFEQSAIEQTAGLNAEMFNDLNAHKIIEVQNPTADNGYTWYRKYADGWVEQGGALTATKSSEFNTITLPVEMQNGNYTAFATNISGYVSGTGSSHAYVMAKAGVVNSLTTTSIGVFSQNSGEKYSWQVSGMAAQ